MKRFQTAVVGSGPAGLMVASVLAQSGVQVSLFDKRKALGRKLLIAGSSGLNITFDAPLNEFAQYYGESQTHFSKVFHSFSPEDWRAFIENQLGIPTFKGTSKRYFVDGMKASLMLKKWTETLVSSGVKLCPNHNLRDFELSQVNDQKINISFEEGSNQDFDAVCLALGGGSWEPNEVPLRWVELFKRKKLKMIPFESGNSGFEVDWPPALLKEAEGKPLKNLILSSSKGSRAGELVITRYGLEGTPIYAVGTTGTIHLDLKPELGLFELLSRLSAGKENLSPIRRVNKYLRLSEGAAALAFHMTPPEIRSDLNKLASRLKRFPLRLKGPRPLAEAISSTGGLSWGELNESLMLKRFPGVFAAGEMIDWHAPTGGFLIQGCVSEGYFAAQAMLKYLKNLAA